MIATNRGHVRLLHHCVAIWLARLHPKRFKMTDTAPKALTGR